MGLALWSANAYGAPMTRVDLVARLAGIALVGLPLCGLRSGVVVEASGDAFEDARTFLEQAGWLDAEALVGWLRPR